MLGRVVVENGVKKIVPLTADCGSGNPVGTVIAVYSNKVPNGYLPCNGVAFDTAQFPVLYALLQDDHTPDLRECTLKGIGESGRTVGAHVKTGGLAVGEFIDDRIQNIKVDPDSESSGICAWTDGALVPLNSPFIKTTPQTYWKPSSGDMGLFQSLGFDASKNVRAGATTEVKAVGVNWCIKATSGINENQADNVLSALSPVDTVASGDMHAVTSNAVADKISSLDVSSVGGSGKYISAISETDGKINATATDLGNMVPVNSVTSGNMHSVTSGAVYDYVFSGNRDNKITNYNNALNNGFYYVNGDTVNCPPASLGFLGYNGDGALFVQRYSDDWICQICQDFRGNGGLYVRSKNEGTWGSWSRVSSTDWERLVTLNSENYFEGKLNGNDKIIRGHFNDYAITTLTFGATVGILPTSYAPNTRMCALIEADIGSSGRVPCIVLINTDRNIRLYPIIQNQYTGSISNVRLFGDVLFYLV